jgi:hypothetical protein
MRHTVLAVLILLVLGLGALNARLQDREQRLLDRLSLLERKPVALAPLPAIRVEPAPPTPPTPAIAASPASLVEKAPTETAPPLSTSMRTNLSPGYPIVDPLPIVVEDVNPGRTLPGSYILMKGDPVLFWGDDSADLGLTDAQRILIDGYKKMGELESRLYKDKLKEIEERTRDSIRRSLDPEQLQKYDAPRGLVGSATFTVQLSK